MKSVLSGGNESLDKVVTISHRRYGKGSNETRIAFVQGSVDNEFNKRDAVIGAQSRKSKKSRLYEGSKRQCSTGGVHSKHCYAL